MSMTVVAIDDSPTVRDILKLTLDQAGMTVILAESAEEGLRRIEEVHPDVVITDAQMPGLDGYDLIDRLRARAEFAGLPIYLLTTDGPDDVADRAQRAGATGWIEKPFSPPALLHTLRSIEV